MTPQQTSATDAASKRSGNINGRNHQHAELVEHASTKSPRKGVRFWGIMIALCIATLLGSLETTIVTTSLPTIVDELHIGNNYVWITNVLFLTRYATP